MNSRITSLIADGWYLDSEPRLSGRIQPAGSSDVNEKLEKLAEQKASKLPIAMDESEDYAVSLANAYRPSAMGLSFVGDFATEKSGFRVELVSVGRLANDEVVESATARY